MTPSLTTSQEESILTICLMAAFADGSNSDAERAEVKKIADSVLGGDAHTAKLYQDVLLGRVDLQSASDGLAGSPAAALAYEMAVCVCDADDAQSPQEKDFLGRLRGALQLDQQAAAQTESGVESLALAPVAPPPLPAPQAAPAAPPDAPEADGMILNYAILNGALELLPETLATMAIIPMQMKMVYRVGKLHGVELDRGHIKEFAAAAGVGLTSQVVEGFARKLLGGVLGKKGMVRRVADQVTSSAFSFASTYALGHVANLYYAGGRRMGTAELKGLFNSTVSRARGMHEQYLPQIQQKAAGLDLGKILAEVRSGGTPTV